MDALGPTLVSFIADDDAPGARETVVVVKLFLRKVTAGRAEATARLAGRLQAATSTLTAAAARMRGKNTAAVARRAPAADTARLCATCHFRGRRTLIK